MSFKFNTNLFRFCDADEDDWGKLKRVLKYLSGTKYLKLKLRVDDLGQLKWYVDGSHNVHGDCRGHAGAMLSMGKGAVVSYSRNIKMNTRSLTETELVGADMFMPEIIWLLCFIQLQGYEAECIRLYQDNTNSQLLMKNGFFLCGKKTKLIKAKFFFIKNKVDVGEVRVIDCSTEEIWADILTKPLQGMAFRKMQAELMKCTVMYEEREEDKTSSRCSLLTGRGKPALPSQTPQ